MAMLRKSIVGFCDLFQFFKGYFCLVIFKSLVFTDILNTWQFSDTQLVRYQKKILFWSTSFSLQWGFASIK